MGLWALDADLQRIPTALVDQYSALAAAGTEAVGTLQEVHHVS
jgi:hypothetical protein